MTKLKKICIIIIVICTIIIIAVLNMSDDSSKKTYTITGETLGEYGKKITLNKNTDIPVDKYLYKIPAGSYIVTTNNDKVTSFFIVKDDVVNNGDDKYPEELNYVKSFLITSNDSMINDTIKKEFEIEVKEDESIQLVGTDDLNITEK